MLVTFIIFAYHSQMDREGPLGEITTAAVPNAFIKSSRLNPGPTAHEQHASSSEDEASQTAVASADPSKRPKISLSNDAYKPHGLTTDDIVLMFKTGATVLWKRVPIHLVTSLSSNRIQPENVLLYSDSSETIGPWEFIDVLANASDKARHSKTFQPYLQQEDFESRQNYADLSNVPGDGAGLVGGWKLDKWKFLPIVQHAGRNKPNAKWYIFMEDESYIFLPNLLRHLEQFNHQDPWYIGQLTWKYGDYFAHGGSGFALSRGAWEQSFGKDPEIIEKFEAFTEAHGCGDHILGHVLQEYGVKFGENTTDNDRYRYGFNSESHWSTWYEPANWCKPVYSWHHTHGKDVARFYSLEQSWDFEKVCNEYLT